MAGPALKVRIFDGEGTHVLLVPKSTVTLGRAAHCDVMLDHPSVRAEHVRAWLEGGRVWIQDLGVGPTTLNGTALPPLKPMLVRDRDVIQVGACESTVGLEPNGGGSSAAAEEPPEITRTDVSRTDVSRTDVPRSEEGKSEQVAVLRRELAELRLQSQMNRMEKSSSEELFRQLQGAQDEVRGFTQQKQQWLDTVKRLEDEKANVQLGLQRELAEQKQNSAAYVKARGDAEAAKLKEWKKLALIEAGRRMSAVSAHKVKSWVARPLSQDMIFEWEGELNQVFKSVMHDEPAPVALPPLPESMAGDERTSLPPLRESPPPVVPRGADRRGKQRRRMEPDRDDLTIASRNWLAHKTSRKPVGLIVTAVVAVLAIAWWLGGALLMPLSSSLSMSLSTTPSGSRSFSSYLPKAHPRFEPKQTQGYKGSYTDNVLLTENYIEAERNPDFHRYWSEEVAAEAQRSWQLDGASAALLVDKERALILDLASLKDTLNSEADIGKMRTRERQFEQEALGIVKDPMKLERFKKFKRAFFMRNQRYLIRQ